MCHAPSYSNDSVLPSRSILKYWNYLLLTTTGKFHKLSPNWRQWKSFHNHMMTIFIWLMGEFPQ